MPTATDTTLIIRHLPNTTPPLFEVQRLRDGKRTPRPISVPSPVGYPVEGMPDSDLLRGLRWYLEDFLQFPFDAATGQPHDPVTGQAARVQAALKNWGRDAFRALFDTREAGRFFDAATEADYAALRLQIASDDVAVLAWPWEALYDPQAGRLAAACQIERRLNDLRDPPPLSPNLPGDRVNILLVIARPYEADVRFRSVARPLVEMAVAGKIPADVTVLRPPTLDELRDHLRQRPGHYHILHFDGHGSYRADGDGGVGITPHQMASAEGRLIFEKADGSADPIKAELLTELLREHAVPVVVLNACQSAAVDERADNPFTSVAAALLRAGMRGVVAMAYSLYVSAAQQFLPAFYRRLFEKHNLAEAVRAGRQQMEARPQRRSAAGVEQLEDWLVPVLYQQEAFDFSFLRDARAPERHESPLPQDARDLRDPYGFVGRDGALLALERALRRPPPAVLISGLGGVGKTTLAKSFLKWLEDTNGLGGVYWLSFAGVQSAEYVLNRIGEQFVDPDFGLLPSAKKGERLAAVCRERPLLLVWDNFESAKGVPGTAVTPKLSDEDCGLLRSLLEMLRGGKTKVLITSRSTEDWLGATNRFVLPLAGLDGEERWEYAAAILDDLGRSAKRGDMHFAGLMNLLNGHPLAMRVILPRLETTTSAELTQALQTNFRAMQSKTPDENEARLFAMLQLATQALPAERQPLLFPLSLHEGYVNGGWLESMSKQVDPGWQRSVIDDFLRGLTNAGVLRDLGGATYEMHPALTGFLRPTAGGSLQEESRAAWQGAFVEVLAASAGQLTAEESHERRAVFGRHVGNFVRARELAGRLRADRSYIVLTQSLAVFAQGLRDFAAAADLFLQSRDHCERCSDPAGVARACHHLGMIAQEKGDFAAAEEWFLRSLAVSEKYGREEIAAITYHELATMAEQRRDFDAAERWSLRSLAIKEKSGNEQGAALSYHELGIIAESKGDFAGAEWAYLKSLALSEKHGLAPAAAGTYNQLGSLADRTGDSVAAERWYHKSLAINENNGNEHGAAITYHQLGVLTHKREEFDAAEQWYRKALAVWEKSGNVNGAASTYAQLGLLSMRLARFRAAGLWLLKALMNFTNARNEHSVRLAANYFLQNYETAPPKERAEVKALWDAVPGLPPLPDVP
jgi:tetratricopeptide (TPR) repeat protein